MITLIRVPFKDVDLSQRIHYTALFSYFEVADHAFFREIGYPYQELLKQNYHLPRVSVNCDYLGMIEYDDVLQVDTSIAKIGHSSFTYIFKVRKGAVDAAKGSMTIVFIDKESGRSIPIPSDIRNQLEKHQTSPVDQT
jgi:acyl-CoA thioester hydrolase